MQEQTEKTYNFCFPIQMKHSANFECYEWTASSLIN